jgi:hypothetical protein
LFPSVRCEQSIGRQVSDPFVQVRKRHQIREIKGEVGARESFILNVILAGLLLLFTFSGFDGLAHYLRPRNETKRATVRWNHNFSVF